jgi:hypothetical protein
MLPLAPNSTLFRPHLTAMSEPKLLDRVHSVARLRHLSLSTERTYSNRSKRFILFHHKRHPSEMGADHIRGFLSHLLAKSTAGF